MITEAIWLLGQDTHNIEEIQRRVQRWRLIDCSETVLGRMKTALLKDMSALASQLVEANELFQQYIEMGNPSGAISIQEKIEVLTTEWQRLKRHLQQVNEAMLERSLRSRLEQRQLQFDHRLKAVSHKLDLLAGETKQALIALERVAQVVSSQASVQDLAQALTKSLTEDFYCLQASVHLFEPERMALTRLAGYGLPKIAPLNICLWEKALSVAWRLSCMRPI